MNSVAVPISLGELVDKITILEIKEYKLENNKAKNVINELNQLTIILNNLDFVIKEKLIDNLREVNKNLWEIEDLIRLKEKENNFDDEFIKLARAVYKNNDERSKIKRNINIIYKSDIIEEKSYK
tara:strand:- start:179 stop:553 length:375 start_codon:yes stop_codon:yes gene_type:complete